MQVRLTSNEKRIARELAEIKKKSTSHSPSPAMLANIGAVVEHDFCFLSNPHATELFLRYFKRDFKDERKLRSFVEHYPSQNRALAAKLAESPLLKGAPPTFPKKWGGGMSDNPRLADSAPPFVRGMGDRNIFVGNGATEIIQAVLQTFTTKKVLVPVPTFSPYLEFAPKGVRVAQHQLQRDNLFRLNLNRLLADIRKEKPDTVVIINPNNPDGGYVNADELQSLLDKLRHVPTVIVDESFIHFAQDADRRRYRGADGRRFQSIESVAPLVKKYPNLVVIKSLSKDFGVAGVRLGYAVMSEKRVSALLERGYLWNVSGFGEYFLNLLNDMKFLREYEQARQKAIGERDVFFQQLSRVGDIKVYPSKANMFLIELTDGSRAEDLTVALLARYGIYVRLCKDKVGLHGEFIRIASRTAKENKKLIQGLRAALS